MRTNWIFCFAVAAALVAACLSGVEGDRSARSCDDDGDCLGFLGMFCSSRGECVNTSCEGDGDCAGIGGAGCEGGECRVPCSGKYGCGGGAICNPRTGFCEPEETGQVGQPCQPVSVDPCNDELQPLGPGVAGGGGAPPPIPEPPFPEDGFDN